MTTVTFPAGSLTAIRSRGRVFVLLDDVLLVLKTQRAVLSAGDADPDLISLLQTQIEIFEETVFDA